MHHGAKGFKYPPNQPPTMNHTTTQVVAIVMYAVITIGAFIGFAALVP